MQPPGRVFESSGEMISTNSNKIKEIQTRPLLYMKLFKQTQLNKSKPTTSNQDRKNQTKPPNVTNYVNKPNQTKLRQHLKQNLMTNLTNIYETSTNHNVPKKSTCVE